MDAKLLIAIITGAAIFTLAQTNIPTGIPIDPAETSPVSPTPAAIPGGGQLQNHQSFTQLPSPEPVANPVIAATNSDSWMTNLTNGALTNRSNWWWR